MVNLASLHAVIHGRVQGVSFRAFVVERAGELGLKGEVRNLPGGQDIEVQAEGDKEKLQELEKQLRVGPPAARIEKVTAIWSNYHGKFSRFKVRY